MDALIQAARDQRVREISGDVLAANTRMLRFAESLGFDVRPSDDPEIRKIVLRRISGPRHAGPRGCAGRASPATLS